MYLREVANGSFRHSPPKTHTEMANSAQGLLTNARKKVTTINSK